MNSLPKAGTNLLYRCLLHLAPLRRKGIRTLMYWDEDIEPVLRKISGLRKGQFLVAHLRDHPLIFELMRQKDIRPIMMVRDPRKVVLSHVHYVSSIDTTHRSHHYFATIDSHSARIDAVIDGVEGIVVPIDRLLDAYARWCSDPEILVVRYEDLVGERGGGSASKQYDAVCAIASHVGVSLASNEVEEIAEKLFSSASPTFRTARIDGWQDEYNEEQLCRLNKKIGAWLERFDYASGVPGITNHAEPN
jgi:hypothetical protein